VEDLVAAVAWTLVEVEVVGQQYPLDLKTSRATAREILAWRLDFRYQEQGGGMIPEEAVFAKL
jgi:hypothetical protein